jgi:hypothetical protein
MLKQLKRVSAASFACAALMMYPAIAEARVQKPSAASKRAPHLRTYQQMRSAYRPVVRQDWRYRWWNSMNVHQKTDWMLYGTYMD